MTTYEKIEALCTEKGLTISEVCTATGVRRSVLTELKMGRTKTLSIRTTEKIAAFFALPTAYFIEDDTDGEIPETKAKRMQLYHLTQSATEEELDVLLTIMNNIRTGVKGQDENAK